MKKKVSIIESKIFTMFVCKLWLVMVGVLCILTNCCIPLANAQTTDQRYDAYLNDFCFNPFTGTTDSKLIDQCRDAYPGGLSTPGLAGSTTSSQGVLGAQGRTSSLLAQQQRKGIEERLEELKQKEDKKRKRTTDGGESIGDIFGKWGIFASGMYRDTDRDKTTLENGYDAELKGVSLGFDYRFSEKIIMGVIAGFNEEDADFNGDAGHLRTDSRNVTLFGNFTLPKDIDVNAYAGYTNIDYESTRTVVIGNLGGRPRGTTDGDQILAGFTAGKNWYFFDRFTIGPQLKLDYSNTSIDSYHEKGGPELYHMRYRDQTIHSLTTSLGFQTSYAQSIPRVGVFRPYARLHWLHQYTNSSRSIRRSVASAPSDTFSTKTDSDDRNYMVFGGGFSTELPHGVHMFADYETTFSHEFLHVWTTTFGFRIDF